MSKQMKAWAVTSLGEDLEYVNIPAPPEPRGKEVVLSVSHCGVCHTDIYFWEGHMDLGGKQVPFEGLKPPYALGHEIVAEVVSIGPDVESVSVGDRRLVFPWIGCGTCSKCLAGQDNLCTNMRAIGVRGNNGGFADLVAVPDEKYLIDIGDLDPATAATYACSGLTVYAGIKKMMPLEHDEPVVVVGAGGLGLQAVALLKALGFQNIIAIDLSEESRKTAMKMGATATADGQNLEEIKALAGKPIPAVLDLVNNVKTAQMSLDILTKGGTLVQIGLYGGMLELPLNAMPLRVLSIKGSYVGTLAEMRELIEIAKSADIHTIPIKCTARHNATEALNGLRDGTVTGRIVLDSSL